MILVERYPVKGGKTKRAIELAKEALAEGKRVLYITVDDTRSAIYTRLGAVENIQNLDVLPQEPKGVVANLNKSGAGFDVVVVDTYRDESIDIAKSKVYPFDLYYITQSRRF